MVQEAAHQEAVLGGSLIRLHTTEAVAPTRLARRRVVPGAMATRVILQDLAAAVAVLVTTAAAAVVAIIVIAVPTQRAAAVVALQRSVACTTRESTTPMLETGARHQVDRQVPLVDRDRFH